MPLEEPQAENGKNFIWRVFFYKKAFFRFKFTTCLFHNRILSRQFSVSRLRVRKQPTFNSLRSPDEPKTPRSERKNVELLYDEELWKTVVKILLNVFATFAHELRSEFFSGIKKISEAKQMFCFSL